MTEKDYPGEIFYSTSGARSSDLSALPQWLIDDVNSRLPLYLHAPSKFDPSIPNETSQSYFMKNFDAYLAGEQFPLPAPAEI
jgi:hypothetical protein